MSENKGPGNWNEFKRFLYNKETGMALRKGEKGPETHLLLDGGRLSVPDERNEEFLARYARALDEDMWVYVVERKSTPAFFMMTEFDIKMQDREINQEELSLIVRTVQQKVMSLAFPEDCRVAVCTAPPKNTTLADGSPAIQSGVHLIWRVPVSIDTAWVLRAWMLRAIENNAAAFGFKIATRWSQAFDPCIFEDNGLRMIGARKAENCPTCKGESYRKQNDQQWGDACKMCRNSGKIDLGRPYDLAYIADESGAPMPDATRDAKSDRMTMVRLTTIRAIGRDPMDIKFPSPETRDILIAQTERDKLECKSSKRKRPNDQTKKEKKTSTNDRGSLVEVTPGTPTYDEIARYVISEFEGAPIVTHVKKCKTGGVYIVNTKSRFCANKGAEHSHSNVYFVIKPTGCVQKCFSENGPYREGSVPCNRYVSKAHKVPEMAQEILFSQAQRKIQRKEDANVRLGTTISRPIVGDERIADEQPKSDHRGIHAGYEYKSAKKKVTPRYSPAQFLEAVSSAQYKIF